MPPREKKKTILVMYYTRGVYPLRDTIRTHLYCWKSYSKHRVLYLNIALGFPAGIIRHLEIDAIIFHTLFLGMRWTREIFDKYVERCRILACLDCVKIAIPQDEFLNTDLLNRFIADFGITHVLTMAGASDIPKIYDRVDSSRVKFKQVLAGYIDPGTFDRIQKKQALPAMDRTFDIGYRAWRAQYWLGEQGTHKARVAEAVEPFAEKMGLRCDISLDEGDVLAGDKWFDFLLRCKATLGAEGGARVLDRNGSIKQCVEEYLRQGNATFAEVERHCFPGHDGEIDLTVITPRHLEACMTGTLQLLVEGRYNGVLSPWRHYVPIKPDYSNIPEVLEVLKNAALVERIVTNSVREIAHSDKWTYPAFVKDVEESVIDCTPRSGIDGRHALHLLSCLALELLDGVCWQFIRFERWVLNSSRRRTLPRLVYNVVVRFPGRF